jgi:glucosamine kinase
MTPPAATEVTKLMPILLAVDAGGTSTRAVALDSSGHAYGYGLAGSGNPTAAGIYSAVTAIADAAELAGAGMSVNAESRAVLAMAGVQSTRFASEVTARLTALGWAQVVLQHDLLGIFHSGTHLNNGYSLIAGTGAVAARVIGGQLDRVVGGRGWLLGDAGGGFWIGHHVARAVVAALDGQQPPTTLTGLVLDAVGIATGTDSLSGRARALADLVPAIYSWRPVQLAQFAPLAFAVHDDPTARAILVAASAALADLVATVRIPDLAGPVVGGGSVLVRGILGAPPELRAELVPPAGDTEVVAVADGVVGACVLALRSAGVEVDETLFRTVQNEVARVSSPADTGVT